MDDDYDPDLEVEDEELDVDPDDEGLFLLHPEGAPGTMRTLLGDSAWKDYRLGMEASNSLTIEKKYVVAVACWILRIALTVSVLVAPVVVIQAWMTLF